MAQERLGERAAPVTVRLNQVQPVGPQDAGKAGDDPLGRKGRLRLADEIENSGRSIREAMASVMLSPPARPSAASTNAK